MKSLIKSTGIRYEITGKTTGVGLKQAWSGPSGRHI